MEVAAINRHYALVRTLALECWRYTEPDTSISAGRALDYAFEEALYRDRNYEAAISLMLPCWLRNDLPQRKWAAHRTLLQAVRLTQEINADIHGHTMEDEDRISELRLLGRRAQQTAGALLNSLSILEIEEALHCAWDQQGHDADLLRDAVESGCLDLISISTVHAFFVRKWRGAAPRDRTREGDHAEARLWKAELWKASCH